MAPQKHSDKSQVRSNCPVQCGSFLSTQLSHGTVVTRTRGSRAGLFPPGWERHPVRGGGGGEVISQGAVMRINPWSHFPLPPLSVLSSPRWLDPLESKGDLLLWSLQAKLQAWERWWKRGRADRRGQMEDTWDNPAQHTVWEGLSDIFSNFFFFFAFKAAPTAYGGSQARVRIGAIAASHSNVRSEPHLGPTTTAYGNAGSLTHWVRPGIKTTSSLILVRFLTHWPAMGTLLFFLNQILNKLNSCLGNKREGSIRSDRNMAENLKLHMK